MPAWGYSDIISSSLPLAYLYSSSQGGSCNLSLVCSHLPAQKPPHPERRE